MVGRKLKGAAQAVVDAYKLGNSVGVEEAIEELAAQLHRSPGRCICGTWTRKHVGPCHFGWHNPETCPNPEVSEVDWCYTHHRQHVECHVNDELCSVSRTLLTDVRAV